MNKNKSLFVKALSATGPLIIMLNIAVGASPALASGPYSFQSQFSNNNQGASTNNNFNDSFAPWYDPSSALSMNYNSNTPWDYPSQPGNSQLNPGVTLNSWNQDMNNPSFGLPNFGEPGVPFDPSEYISNPLMPIVNPTESTVNHSPFSVPNANSINNVHPSNGFQPPNCFGTNYGNNHRFPNLQNNNTPSPSGATLPRLNLPFNQGRYNLNEGGDFCSYLKSLYSKKIIMNKNVALGQAQVGLELAQNNEDFSQALQDYGITLDEIRNTRLPSTTPRTRASEIYAYFAQNYRVWAAIFNALIYLGHV